MRFLVLLSALLGTTAPLQAEGYPLLKDGVRACQDYFRSLGAAHFTSVPTEEVSDLKLTAADRAFLVEVTTPLGWQRFIALPLEAAATDGHCQRELMND